MIQRWLYVSKHCLDGSGEEAPAHAKYLLDSLYDNSVGGDTLPSTFANRQPFQAVLDRIVRYKKVRREFDRADSDSLDPDSKPSPSAGGGADQQHPTSGTDASSAASRGGGEGTAHENNQGTAAAAAAAAGVGGGGGEGGTAPMSPASALSLFAPPAYRDVANELDLLDMVDESEQYEIVRSFASKHIVPYMIG
jgi:hypothetical protein